MLAARQRAADLAAPLAERRKQRIDIREPFANLGGAAHHAADLEVFFHRHLLEDPAALWHEHDAGAGGQMRRLARDIAAVEQNAARGRLHQPHDRLDSGAFSRAVRAEERDQLPLLDREADAVQHFDLAIGGAQAFNRERHPGLQ